MVGGRGRWCSLTALGEFTKSASAIKKKKKEDGGTPLKLSSDISIKKMMRQKSFKKLDDLLKCNGKTIMASSPKLIVFFSENSTRANVQHRS